MQIEEENGATGVAEVNQVNGGTTEVPEASATAVAVPTTTATSTTANNKNVPPTKAQLQETARKYLAKQTQAVIIPSFAAWHNRDQIHEIEKRSLPEFFTGKNASKTPEAYREFRDFMMDTYRLNPSEYLTVTACRRNLAGDVASIIRVHSFLEKWGLINYQIDPETRPSLFGPQFTGHFQVTLDTPKGLKPLMTEVETQKEPLQTQNGSSTHSEVKVEESDKLRMLNMPVRKSVYDTSADALALVDANQRRNLRASSRVYNCFTCGEEVTDVRYHNLHTKHTIDALCFKQGLFPANANSSDYVRLKKEQQQQQPWSDQETLLLLEGVEMYADNWEGIAYHVGTRSKEACVVKFLQLPIEEPYLVKNSEAAQKLLQQQGSEQQKQPEPARGTTASSANITSMLKDLKDALSKDPSNLTARARDAIREEEAQQTELLNSIVEATVHKVDLKLKTFESLEASLSAQQREIDDKRLQMFIDRLSLKAQADNVLSKLRQAASSEGDEAVALAQEAVKIASRNPKITVVSLDTIKEQTQKQAQVQPSLDQPQKYTVWSG